MKSDKELLQMHNDLAAGLSLKEVALKHKVTYNYAMKLLKLGRWGPRTPRVQAHDPAVRPYDRRPVRG